jgi:predicted dehydrogenase
MSRTRYLVVGTGSRSNMFISAIVRDYHACAELVGFCDVNQVRMDWYNRKVAEWGGTPVPTATPDGFDRLVRETKADVVIVTSVDRTHHRYIIRAMELGCDAISEKPMTVDAEKAQEVLDAIARTGRRLRVTFNYRYAPRNSKVKELLMQGAIGDVLSVHFEWLLDTRHGADYFRRWHRDKRNSGGLMVHKSTHHFDLVNWWLASRPVQVFGMGRLAFYGRENAERRGVTAFYERATGNPVAANDPFALHLDRDPNLAGMYLEAERVDGYLRDQSVFGNNISIEDDMGVMVRYASQAVMTYHLTAYSPWEGYRIAFNGTRGRLEYDCEENSYVSGADGDANRPDIRDASEHLPAEPHRILVRPHWGKPMKVEVETASGGHGGGDKRLLDDVFIGGQADPLGRAADHIDGCRSILTGIAANRSFATGLPVAVDGLVRGLGAPG